MARSHLRLLAFVTLAWLPACGGVPAGPSTDPGEVTRTFMGSARIAENGGCASLTPSNEFSAGAGTLTVTLVQATAPRLMVQVCAPGEANHTQCTVPPFSILAPGQSLSATVKGGRTQVVTAYPEGCGGPGSVPGAAVDYVISVVHPR